MKCSRNVPVFCAALPKQRNLVPRASRLPSISLASMLYCWRYFPHIANVSQISNLIVNGCLRRISLGIWANQKRRRIFWMDNGLYFTSHVTDSHELYIIKINKRNHKILTILFCVLRIYKKVNSWRKDNKCVYSRYFLLSFISNRALCYITRQILAKMPHPVFPLLVKLGLRRVVDDDEGGLPV